MRRANAIGAAIDYTVAQQFGKTPSLSERAERLETLWIQLVGDDNPNTLPGIIEEEIKGNLASLATNHILSGDTAAAPASTPPTEEPIGIGMGELF